MRKCSTYPNDSMHDREPERPVLVHFNAVSGSLWGYILVQISKLLEGEKRKESDLDKSANHTEDCQWKRSLGFDKPCRVAGIHVHLTLALSCNDHLTREAVKHACTVLTATFGGYDSERREDNDTCRYELY